MDLFFAFLMTRPEFNDPKRCRKKLVGPMREFLSLTTGAALYVRHIGSPAHAVRMIEGRARAQDEIAEFCAMCGRCKWGR